jgi:DNA adenine methylase
MSDLIKWSGSKDSQSKKILEYFPKEIDCYYEPFLGGGSVFLSLLESDIKVNKFILSDVNEELIGIYKLIKDNPNNIIETYKKHYKEFNSGDIQKRKDYFNEIRKKFNEEKLSEDFYWIMRTTTSGLPRWNNQGMFNNSCHFSRSGMSSESVEKIVIKYNRLFNSKKIDFIYQSYDKLDASIDDIIYMDPPYQNTKGMYYGNFNSSEFLTWLDSLSTKWLLSYDGKINEDKVNHISPFNYKRHEYLISGNSSFRRVIGKSNDTIISESLYLNF